MHETDHNHHTKADNMTLSLILDDQATIIQRSPKTWCARIAKELIKLHENVKIVLIAWKLDTSVMSAAPRGQVI